MLINTSSNYSRQRFTACHELYHLLYQDNFTVSYDTNDDGEGKEIEEQAADYFARCLLLPKEGVVALVPVSECKRDTISLATILKLEQTFRCSRSCLLYRLKEMGFITDIVYNVYLHDVIKSAAEYGYPVSLYKPTYTKELVGDYNVKARQLYDRGMISQAKYFSLLYDMGIDLERRFPMARAKVILVDADVISHFIATDHIYELNEILSPHQLYIVDNVYKEATYHPSDKERKNKIDEWLKKSKACRISFPKLNRK